MTGIVNACHLLMMELGMTNRALQELLNRVHATTPTKLQSFKSVMHWDSLTAKVYNVEAEFARVFRTPDLNHPAPQDDDEGPSEEKKSVITRFVNLCHLFMMELGMTNRALEELLNRAHATTTAELESFKSVKHWDSLTANVYDVEAEIARGPYNPNFKTPDLNQPVPQDDDEGFMQDIGKAVEAETSTTAGKRKITEANHSVKKRSKFTQDSVGPATGDKGKGAPKWKAGEKTEEIIKNSGRCPV